MTMTENTVAEAISFCVKQVGKPYRWGGTGPNSWDCSGLMQAGYRAGGVYIPRATGGQQFAGREISLNGPFLPGDLIFPFAGHVYMYIGEGKIVEAPRTGLNVRVVDVPRQKWKVRRIATAPQTAWNIELQKAGFGWDDIGKGLKKGAEWGSGWTDKVPFIGHSGDAVHGAIDGVKAINDFVHWILEPFNWLRIGMFVGGLAVLFIAFRGLAMRSARAALTGGRVVKEQAAGAKDLAKAVAAMKGR